MCCLLCAREGIERTQKKLHFFHSFLYHQSGTVRVRSPLETEARNRNSSSRAFTKICRNTRVDSHSHAHALKTFTSSRPRKKKRERERERYVSFARAFFSFKTRSRVSSSIHLSCPKNRNVARLPSISYQKSPSTYTGDTTTQERIDKYAHI